MSDLPSNKRPEEQPAVRTTIVGGRPPGSGRGFGQIPRGIEVLVKKAAVDPDFRSELLEKRAGAAGLIGLTLERSEAAMIDSIPSSQLESIITNTTVPDAERRAFLGKIAVAMLAVLGAGMAGCRKEPATDGIRPDVPMPQGIRPDMPATQPAPASNDVTYPAPMAGVMASPPPSDTGVSRGVRPDNPVILSKGHMADMPPPRPNTNVTGTATGN